MEQTIIKLMVLSCYSSQNIVKGLYSIFGRNTVNSIEKQHFFNGKNKSIYSLLL